jgi:hypothetical protein
VKKFGEGGNFFTSSLNLGGGVEGGYMGKVKRQKKEDHPILFLN